MAADGVAGADPELSPIQGAGFQKLIFFPADQMDSGLDMTKKSLPFRSQLYPFGTADKQRLVKLLLQYLNGLAYG